MRFDYNDVDFPGSRYSDATKNVKGHRHEYYEWEYATFDKKV